MSILLLINDSFSQIPADQPQFPPLKKLCMQLTPYSASLTPHRVQVMHGWAWLAQLVRSLPSNQKVPSSIPGFAEIRIFVQPSFPPKPTQLFILLG